MGKAARKVSAASQSFLGATVAFYAPRRETDRMLADLEKIGVRTKFNATTGGWEAQASMLNFRKPEVNAVISKYGAFSSSYRAAREEKSGSKGELKAVIESERKTPSVPFTIGVVENGVERPLQKEDLQAAPRRSVPLSEEDKVAYAARAAWAKEKDQKFLAAYIIYGFQLTGQRAPERRAQQLAELKAASPDEIREVANRNSQRYGALALKEDRVRFDYIVERDAFWKEKAEAAKEPEARENLFREFSRLDHHEKRELASIGRETPVGLSDEDRGVMVTLSNGFREMENEYFERTKERFSQGIVAAASKQHSAIDASAGSLKSIVAETQSLEGAKTVQRIRDAVDREI